MAKMDEPPRLERKAKLEIILELSGKLSAAETEDNALILLSETLTRGTGCLNWARPGLWGLLVANCPVLPGYRFSLARFLISPENLRADIFSRVHI
jgi:hypothetical protein